MRWWERVLSRQVASQGWLWFFPLNDGAGEDMDKEQRRRTRIPIQLSVSVQVNYERIPVTTRKP